MQIALSHIPLCRAFSASRGVRTVGGYAPFVDGPHRALRPIPGSQPISLNINPAEMVRACARHVRSGGIVAFHEVDWRTVASYPPAALFDRCCAAIIHAFEKIGTDPFSGRALHATFIGAGLPSPTMAMGALIGGGGSPYSGVEMIADLGITMAPAMERCGAVRTGEIDPATYTQSVVEEVTRLGSLVVDRSEIGGWSRVH